KQLALAEALAVVILGEDAGLVGARRRHADVVAQPVDVGLVGDVVRVNASIVRGMLEAGRIPVVSTIAPDVDTPGDVLNVNADTAAAALAVALRAETLAI